MSHTPHELAQDFPEYTDRISDLKQNNSHFARLFDEYHDINRAVHRAETNVEPLEELAEVEMRKKRGVLKDELYKLLSAAA
ncbi:MAG: YdcH family protein [Paracoccaceae bacterium]|nr:YdcH family protein [Paracoccaceae bacterium]MDG1738170.1 YdcH family protein [Paracoccaceae bacterium]MDG2258980.1 YdcH family protein [Paracoccaceae bacterium]